ncbi:MAG: hypothetical protein ACRD2C_10625 [Acidimicrobiales bacterium]
MAIAGAVAGWATANADEVVAVAAFFGAGATLGVAGALLLGSGRLLATAIVGTVGVAAIEVVRHPNSAALLAGMAVFVQAELAFAALDRGPTGIDPPDLAARRWQFGSAVLATSGLLGILALLAADGMAGEGLGLEVLGGLTVVAATALVVALARRATAPRA